MNIRLLIALAGVLVLGGCGGGSSSSSSQPVSDPAASDVITFGTITRFGSVYANGAVFDCDDAAVSMNDEPGTVSDLRIGHVVAIRAHTRTRAQQAVAQTVRCRDAAQGSVTDLDPERHRFTVLGRIVQFDELTVFENVGYDQLANGNVVQVMGLERSENRVQATFVRRIANAWAPGMQMRVRGEIDGLDPALMRFKIGTQWCDYSSATLELESADLANGLYAEVSSTSPVTNGLLLLDQIRARDRDRDRDRDKLCAAGCSYDIEGYITDFISPLEFVVDGTTVTTTPATVYVNGSIDTLALDVRVAVSGRYNEEGVLVASKIVYRVPVVVQVEADAGSIDTAEATVTLLGIRVATDDSTIFRDASDAAVREFWLDDLAVGDRIAVRAYLDGTSVVAARLERVDADENVILKAPVETIGRPALTLLGVTVIAGDGTLFRAADQSLIDAEAFFAEVEPGMIVRAAGVDNGGTVLADTLFIRDCGESCL
jgi:hypothetical protein